ncbi:spore germination protein [Oscillospiraceae bacterium OttesenSCG-928-G22]|nr:spore germination protein [Oscillospiraceae bacterium OttesenSCG-928-G22]
MNNPLEESGLHTALEDNIALMDALFENVDVYVKRRFENERNPAVKFCAFFCDGVVASPVINDHIIKPLLLADALTDGKGLIDRVADRFVMANDVKKSDKVRDLVESVTYGDTILFIDGCKEALILNSKLFSTRGITEPEGEKVLNGPREGFTEGIMQNLSMIRRRARTNDLKMRFHKLGKRTATQICVCYFDGLVNHRILKEFYRRLDGIDIDGILDSNYIVEYVSDASLFGFATAGYTERPDVVVGKLLEGRIALLVDGTPSVLTFPYLFVENFQSSEDYYLHPVYTSFSRLLRMVGFFFSIVTPAIYISLVAFHHDILPPSLMMNIMSEREVVPLPAALEAVIMLLAFDILRETGVRMPSHVGQALGIVGALVIGQAAVEAKLIASPIIIVVAFTGITGLLIPRLSTVVITCRFFLLLLASSLGLLGVVAGLGVLLLHILNLNSFGVPEVTPLDMLQYQEVKDTFFRAPWPKMLTRTASISQNQYRQKK